MKYFVIVIVNLILSLQVTAAEPRTQDSLDSVEKRTIRAAARCSAMLTVYGDILAANKMMQVSDIENNYDRKAYIIRNNTLKVLKLESNRRIYSGYLNSALYDFRRWKAMSTENWLKIFSDDPDYCMSWTDEAVVSAYVKKTREDYERIKKRVKERAKNKE